MKKIALEEHFNGPGFEKYLQAVAHEFDPAVLNEIEKLLPEFTEKRLATMDSCGIDIAVLSQTAPGVQKESNTEIAVSMARMSNDFLARQISLSSGRFRGFACLPLQDPTAASAELERCVKELGFVGALVNGHTNGEYLDAPKFWSFWEKLQELEVPLYLHPGLLFDTPAMFAGRPELSGATWSWTCETASHALRLVFGGVFDKFPAAQIILGHMGETLPFDLWRLDSRSQTTVAGRKMKKLPSQIIREHILITISGVCSPGPLLCSLTELGEDSVMFATDYPYEDALLAARFIEDAPINETQREKICFRNAERVLRL